MQPILYESFCEATFCRLPHYYNYGGKEKKTRLHFTKFTAIKTRK